MTAGSAVVPVKSAPRLVEQGDEDFVGDGQAGGGEPYAATGPLDQALGAQFLDARADIGIDLRAILSLDGREVDAFELAQAEEKLFVKRLLRVQLYELYVRKPGLLDRGCIGGGIVSIGPAPVAIEGMRPRAESEIGFAAPIFQIVPRTKSRQRPIGDFVVVVAGTAQAFAGEFVRISHGIVGGNGRGGVTGAAGEEFAAEPAAFIDLEEIDRDVFGTQAQRLFDGVLPTWGCLMGQAGDEIEGDVVESFGAELSDRRKDICAAVQATCGFQFSI